MGGGAGLESARTTFRRSLYRLAVYSGARALSNCLRHRALPELRLESADEKVLDLGGQSWVIRIHRRRSPRGAPEGTCFGMVSACMKAFPGRTPVYRWMLATSHFGCGHWEAAFFERGGTCSIYAFRNTLQGNLRRLQQSSLGKWFRVSEQPADLDLLKRIVDLIESEGLQPSLASPADCVRYSVSPGLVNSESRASLASGLEARYRKAWSKLQALRPECIGHGA